MTEKRLYNITYNNNYEFSPQVQFWGDCNTGIEIDHLSDIDIYRHGHDIDMRMDWADPYSTEFYRKSARWIKKLIYNTHEKMIKLCLEAIYDEEEV